MRRQALMTKCGRLLLASVLGTWSSACEPSQEEGESPRPIESRVRELNAGAVMVTTLAGSPGVSGSIDDTGAAARFFHPSGVAVDTAGNAYVADSDNNTIRKVTASGVVTTLAGRPRQSGSTDGTGAAARFYYPTGVAVDTSGNVYVADFYNGTIRKVTASGVVTTLAGSPGVAGSADGAGAAAQFLGPYGVAVDTAGNVYVGDSNNYTVRKVTPTGVVTTLAGSPRQSGGTDGTGAAARFFGTYGVAVDTAGNVFATDSSNNTIRKVTASGVVTTLAGSPGQKGGADGTGAAARFNYPMGVAVDPSGNVYVAEDYNNTIRKVTASGVVTTLAGSPGVSGSANGTGAAARFLHPTGVAVDSAGNVYVADRDNHTIRKASNALAILPTTASVTAGNQQAFTASGGGAGPYTWSISVNNSGGSITPSGLYTAGTTGGVIDTIAVTDGNGGICTATVTVLAPLAITTGSGGTVSVPTGVQQPLTASGGASPYTWSFVTDNSGGTLTTEGLYTTGSTVGVTDTVQVTDSTGATATIAITVTSPIPVPASGPSSIGLLGALLILVGLHKLKPLQRTQQ